MILSNFFGALLCLLTVDSPAFVNFSFSHDDSTKIFKTIKANEKKFKLQKSRFFKKVVEADSVELYGTDKNFSKITTVQVIRLISKREREREIYWFNDEHLFKITVDSSARSSIGIWRSRSSGLYFFEDNSIFYKVETNTTHDIQLLLLNANKYFTKGSKMLGD